MNSKQIYEAPETDEIRIKIERDFLQASPINPGGDVPDPGNDGND